MTSADDAGGHSGLMDANWPNWGYKRTFRALPVYILCISSLQDSHGQISEKFQSELYLFIDKGYHEKRCMVTLPPFV